MFFAGIMTLVIIIFLAVGLWRLIFPTVDRVFSDVDEEQYLDKHIDEYETDLRRMRALEKHLQVTGHHKDILDELEELRKRLGHSEGEAK